MGETFDNAKLVVRHVEDTDTPEDAFEGKKRPHDSGFVEIGVEVDGYFEPLASVKAGHFLSRLSAQREANKQRQAEQPPPPEQATQPSPEGQSQGTPPAEATSPGWNQ